MGLGRGAGLDLATLFALFPLLYASKPFTERTTTHTIPINVDGAAMNIVFRPSIDEPYATASAACSEFHISASDCVRVAEHFISLMAPTAAASSGPLPLVRRAPRATTSARRSRSTACTAGRWRR